MRAKEASRVEGRRRRFAAATGSGRGVAETNAGSGQAHGSWAVSPLTEKGKGTLGRAVAERGRTMARRKQLPLTDIPDSLYGQVLPKRPGRVRGAKYLYLYRLLIKESCQDFNKASLCSHSQVTSSILSAVSL